MLTLGNGSRVAVIGGGPAGSFFSYFLLETAARLDTVIAVDVFEPRDFSKPGPSGCNMCGGIVSESLVQILATEGINLPRAVYKRGVDSYVLHMDVGRAFIDTPLHEKRIVSVHRGGGPMGATPSAWRSFDGFLLELAMAKGARLVRERVESLGWKDGRPEVKTKNGRCESYDLLVGAVGVNSSALRLFESMGFGYKAPRATKTHICEFQLGKENVEKYLGSCIHVFLLNLSRLEFAALIPKGDYATLCLMGQDIDADLVKTFLDHPEVRACLPPDADGLKPCCQCYPKMNVGGAVQPFADRVVLIGDSGVSRLYKDGIGAAYRTAKAAAMTAMLEGISADAFRQKYWPTCRKMATDNGFGKAVFTATRLIQRRRRAHHALLCVVAGERRSSRARIMSTALWDTFTGSAPYREVFTRTLRPGLGIRMLWHLILGSRGPVASAE